MKVDLSKEELERVRLWFELLRLQSDINEADTKIYNKLKGDK